MLELYLAIALFGIGSYINKSKETTTEKNNEVKEVSNNNVKNDSKDKDKKRMIKV